MTSKSRVGTSSARNRSPLRSITPTNSTSVTASIFRTRRRFALCQDSIWRVPIVKSLFSSQETPRLPQLMTTSSSGWSRMLYSELAQASRHKF